MSDLSERNIVSQRILGEFTRLNMSEEQFPEIIQLKGVLDKWVLDNKKTSGSIKLLKINKEIEYNLNKYNPSVKIVKMYNVF